MSEAKSVQGRWRVSIDTPYGERSGILDLQTDGTLLTGFMSDGERHVPIADGRIEDGELRWTAKITKPMSLSLKFTARIEGDEIRGDAKHLLGKARFKGTRA